MKSFGSTLFILGLLAFGLNYMNAALKYWHGFIHGVKTRLCGLRPGLRAAAR